MSRWFRFYDEALNDPKVQRLAPNLFKTWVNLLCLASKHAGKLPNNDDIAFQLRLSVQDAAQQMDDLILSGLIDIGPTGERIPHNWPERQYASDSSAERVRKCRERKKKNECNGDGSVTVAVQNRTESETEDNTTVLSGSRARGDEQGVDLSFLTMRKGKAKGGAWEALTRRAEGFGLPVDELDRASRSARNRTAYFTTLAVNRLRDKLPALPEQTLRDALWGHEYATKAVYSALMGASA